MKRISIEEVAGNLSGYLQEAKNEFVIITHQNQAVGLLIGINDADDWWENLLLQNPIFKERIHQAREHLRAGQGVTLEQLREQYSNV